MDKIKYLAASDGTGPAVLAHIDAPRNVGSTVISLDNTDNWSPYFILTTGTLLPSGFIDPGTQCEMFCSLDVNGNAVIEGFCPGYTDQGHTQGQVAVIKQATSWANNVKDVLSKSLKEDGSLKDQIVTPNTLAESVWGWEELGRTTLSNPGSTISVSSLANRKKLKLLVRISTLTNQSMTELLLRLNGISTANYTCTNRRIDNTAIATTHEQSQTRFKLNTQAIWNITSDFELNISNYAGAKTVEGNVNLIASNTAAGMTGQNNLFQGVVHGMGAVNSIQLTCNALMGVGSEIIVLGHD